MSILTLQVLLLVYYYFYSIGDTVAPILRVVPFQRKPVSYFFYKEFKSLHYVSVSKSIVDQVHITLKQKMVCFFLLKTILKLHFRRKKKLV